MFGHANVCRWLHGMDSKCVHSMNEYGCNAVQWGALSGSIATCRMLLEEFCLDFTLLNHNGHSVFHKAAVKGHEELCQWLLVVGRKGLLGVEIATLLLPDKGGCTPSEMARLEGHLNVSKMLLDDVDKNKRMMTQQQQQTTAATVPSAEV